jgi:hypothetical protein
MSDKSESTCLQRVPNKNSRDTGKGDRARMAVRVRRWSDVDARRKYQWAGEDTAGASRAVAGSGSESSDRRSSLNEIVTVRSMNLDLDALENDDTTPLHHPPALEEELEECVICLDDLAPGKALFTAECGHKYHFSCLLENVNHDEANSDKCPICRKSQTQWPEQTKGLVKAHPYCTSVCDGSSLMGSFYEI